MVQSITAKAIVCHIFAARKYYILPGDAFGEAERLIPQHLPQIRYLQKFAGYPVYGSTRTEYFSPGEKFLPVLLQELEKAKKYIFMGFTDESGWN